MTDISNVIPCAGCGAPITISGKGRNTAHIQKCHNPKMKIRIRAAERQRNREAFETKVVELCAAGFNRKQAEIILQLTNWQP